MSFSLTEQAIDTARARAALCHPQAGGYVSFEGWVRDHHGGKGVEKLIYSAYHAMAEQQGAQIIAAALQQFAIEDAACIHRVGELAIGDMAVWVGVSAAHRDSAFAACRYIIDAIKAEVPIWKHEFYQDGSCEWTSNTP